MTRRGTVKGITLLAALTFLSAATPLVAGQQCADTLKNSCTSCHDMARSCQELGKDKDYWQATVARMARYSPSISEDAQATLIPCLAKEKEEVKGLCQQ